MKRYFVATSAKTETWDLHAENIIFAEEGCAVDYKEKDLCNIKFIMPDSRWENCRNFQDETDFLNRIQADILKRLTDAYNEITQLPVTTRDIDRLLYPWLDYYIDTMYYKFFALEDIEKKYNDIYIHGLEEKAFYCPNTPMDFMIKVAKDDLLSLQLYTIVAQYKGIKIEKFLGADDVQRKEHIVPQTSINIKALLRKLYRVCSKIKKVVWCKCINFVSCWAKTVVINPTRFLMSNNELLGVVFRSKGKVGAYFTDFEKLDNFLYNKELRNQFPLDRESVLCDFEQFILNRIVYDIPVNCLEGVEKSFDDLQARRYKRVEKIVNDSGIKCDCKAVKFILSKRDKCKWYNIEIGGSADITRGRDEVDGEERISDIYYTNGWHDDQIECNYRPFYNPRFLKAAIQSDNSIERHGVLYGGTFVPKYRCIHEYTTSRNPECYIENCLELLRILSASNISLTARLYPETGWGLEKRIIDNFSNVVIDRLEEEFSKTVRKYKIYVCDVISTTWGEAYAAGIPILFVGNRMLEHYSPAGSYWINKLRSCGIYQDNAYSAGRYIVSIIDNIEEWWNDIERQNIIHQFANIYAHLPAHLEKNVWIEEIINISKE